MTQHYKKAGILSSVTGQKRVSPGFEVREVAKTRGPDAPLWPVACMVMWAAFLLFSQTNALALVVGDRVQANSTVNVRSTPAGTSLGTQPNGALGTIIGGPQTATLSGTSYVWWQVNWDNNPDGWCAQDFLTRVVPAAPVLSSPSNGATVSGTSVTLIWNSVTGAAAYSVGLRDQVTNTLANIPLITGTSTTQSVIPGHSYVWDVASCISSSGGDNTSNCPNRASNWSFTVQAVAPATPVLSSPSNGATVSGTSVTLSWNPVSGAGAYSVGLRDQVTNTLVLCHTSK